MSDINEKISALYDGELDQSEIDDLLEIIGNDSIHKEKLSLYGLITHMTGEESNETVSITTKSTPRRNASCVASSFRWAETPLKLE